VTSIRTPFEIDTGLGRTRTEPDRSRYIRELMIQLLMTAPGERMDRPDFGCGVRQMVFAANNPATATLAEVVVFQALTRWMGDEIEVREIDVVSTPEAGSIEITITYRDRQSGQSAVLNQVVT
jgi:phage baseplate assembly protein W